MAVTLGEVFVLIKGDDAQLNSKLNKAESRIKRFGAAMSKYVTVPLAAGFGIAAAAAAEAERAEVSLAAALARTGEATRANMDHFEQTATALQKLSVYDDEAILSGMALAKEFGVATDQLDDVAKAAVGLAAISGKDLPTAFQALAMAAKGNIRGLRQFGIIMGETGDKAAVFREAIARGLTGLGTAQALANTTTGRFQQLKNMLGDTAEQFGAVLLPAIAGFQTVMKPLIAGFQAIPGPVKAVIGVVAGLAMVIGPTIGLAIKLGKAWAFVKANATLAAIAQRMAANPLLGSAAGTAVIAVLTAAASQVNAMVGQASSNYEDLLKQLNRGMAGLKLPPPEYPNLPTPGETEDKNETTLAQLDQARKLNDQLNDQYEEQARKLWDIYQNLRNAREEEEQRQRAAIGWANSIDIWKRAAEEGARHRFGPPETSWAKIWEKPMAAQSVVVEPALWRRALALFERQTRATESLEDFFRSYFHLNRGGLNLAT